jgi:hypothetical protein
MRRVACAASRDLRGSILRAAAPGAAPRACRGQGRLRLAGGLESEPATRAGSPSLEAPYQGQQTQIGYSATEVVFSFCTLRTEIFFIGNTPCPIHNDDMLPA